MLKLRLRPCLRRATRLVDHDERTEQIVSASREKKTRQDMPAQGPTGREQKKQREAKEAKQSTILYATVGILCTALAVFLIVWNSGIIQRNATALTVNGVKYTAGDVQYYFNTVLSQNGVNSAAPLKSTIINAETGMTMYDYLMDQAVDLLVNTTALADKAAAEGYTMSAETKEYLDNQLSQLDTLWVASGYKSLDAYLRANYGPYMTYDRFVNLYTKSLLVNDYSSTYVNGLEYVDSEYEGYYQDNTATLDSYTISQFVVQAQVETTDADGKTIEMTDEEKATALEQSKTKAKAVAEEIQSKLASGEGPSALAAHYAEQLSGTPSISTTVTGANVASSPYAEWAQDSARKAGDVTLSEYDAGSTSYYYYVILFENRTRDDTPTDSVRHVLVAAETAEGAAEPTEEQYAAAKAKAQELLDQWKSGPATEDSFAQLAKDNSADTGSAADGGLISNIYSGSGYVATFTDWATDDARRPGDTGLVQNTGSTTKGWHIMYYVGAEGDPVWKITAKSAMTSKDYNAWQESAKEGYEATRGIGMKFIQA